MIRSIKLLGLCAMALCAMAFATSSAQAAAPEWMVNTQNVGSLQAELQITGIENNTASLLTTILGASIEILCTQGHLSNAKTLPNGELTHGRVDFLHCVTYLEGSTEASEACEPYTEEGGVKSPGLILTNKGKGHIALHTGGVRTTVLEPANLAGSGEPTGVFVNILLGPEGECGFAENVPVEGKLVLEDCENKGEVEQPEHLIEESSHLELLTSLGVKATIDGSANVGLAGTHEGLSWRGLWN